MTDNPGGYHPMESYIMIGFSIFLGSLFVGGAIITSKILAFRSPEGWRKVQPYECSENPIGGARIRFKVAFYIFALLFLIFDIEALFLFPCMKIFKSVMAAQNGSISPVVLLTELTVFVFILFAGLIYAWRKGVLIWE
jgi:NADH-quinone oxidoreductase subunit A